MINLSNKFDPTDREVINVKDNNDNMSAMTNLSNLSKDELIERLKRAQKATRGMDSKILIVRHRCLVMVPKTTPVKVRQARALLYLVITGIPPCPRRLADSWHQLPTLVYGEGTATSAK